MCPKFILVTILIFLQIDFKIVSSQLFVTKLVYTNDSVDHQNTESISTKLISEKKSFKAYLEVGSNGFKQEVIMDTGSNLLWINCEPTLSRVPIPAFDPSTSSTFQVEHCPNSEYCLGGQYYKRTGSVSTKCVTRQERCGYEVRYAGGIESVGYLARDNFKFEKDSTSLIENIIFGCCEGTNLYTNGVLGLGTNPLSLLSQTSSYRFSYCVGDIINPNYEYNKLLIGNDIELLDAQTPMIIDGYKYYITLESITFGDQPLNIDPKIFTRNTDEHSGGMLIDSGTTLSFLPDEAVNMLREEIGRTAAASNLIQNYSIVWNEDGDESVYYHVRMCFNGKFEDNRAIFPTIALRFLNQADMFLEPFNYFNQVNDQVFCFAIIPVEAYGAGCSIMGAIMQQSTYIVFDTKAEILSFEARDCSSMDAYIHDELSYNN